MLASSLCCWLDSGGMVFLPRCGSLLCLIGDVFMGLVLLSDWPLGGVFVFDMRTRRHDFSFFSFSLFGFIFDSPSITFLFLISSHLLTYMCQHLYVCSDRFFFYLGWSFWREVGRMDGKEAALMTTIPITSMPTEWHAYKIGRTAGLGWLGRTGLDLGEYIVVVVLHSVVWFLCPIFFVVWCE